MLLPTVALAIERGKVIRREIKGEGTRERREANVVICDGRNAHGDPDADVCARISVD